MIRKYFDPGDLGMEVRLKQLATLTAREGTTRAYEVLVEAAVLGTDGDLDDERRHAFHVGYLKNSPRSVRFEWYRDEKQKVLKSVTLPRVPSSSASRKNFLAVAARLANVLTPKHPHAFRDGHGKAFCKDVHGLLTAIAVMKE